MKEQGVLFAASDLAGPQIELPWPIKRLAEVSPCGQYRWTLTRVWAAGPYVLFLGLNPSTADALKDDPTSWRWIQFACRWGYGGYVAANLYPFRSASPADCKRWADWESNGPDWYARDRLMDNVHILATEARRCIENGGIIVACWGAGAWDDDWTEHCIEEIQTVPGATIYCLGRTAGGDPIHPMARGRHRVPDDAQPEVWRAA